MTTLIQIAVLDDYQGVAGDYAQWDALAGRAQVTFYRDHIDDPGALVDRLLPYDVVCVMRERTPLTAPLLGKLPRLKLIVTTGMRNASLDIAHANAQGIVVCGTGSGHTGTPQLVWLHILAHARHFQQESADLRQGRWQTTVGRDLSGATLGIVGLGRVGTHVARVGNAFGMNVIAWSPNMTAERASAAGAEFVSKQALFQRSDYVVIAMQLRESTRNIVGNAELALMKPDAFLVNTSRAGLVDEAALVDALRGGRIAGAGLDVFDPEPLPENHVYRSLPNVILTPHIGYVTEQNYALFYRETVENILAWLDNAPVRVLTGQE